MLNDITLGTSGQNYHGHHHGYLVINMQGFLPVALVILELRRRGREIHPFPVLEKKKKNSMNRIKYYKFILLYCLCLNHI